MSLWSVERVTQLAPDSASAKAAQGLAKPAQWQGLGQNNGVLWGECQGSGAKPYQVRVELEAVAYRCTCPSRKQPCKHTLGLLLLYAAQTNFPQRSEPEYVKEWLESRADRREAKAARDAQAAAPPDPEAQLRRAEKRETRIEAGLDQLESWLKDLVAQGLAGARRQPPAFWSQMAARLVDAQAPGLSRRVLDLGSAALGGDSWPDRLLTGLGRLQLVIDAYRRIDQLPGSLAASVRTLIGWTQKQDQLLAQTGTLDRWQVVGRRLSGEDSMRIQSTWVWGARSAETAVILEFAVGKNPLPVNHLVGQVFEAELVWFPGVAPHRALVKPLVKNVAAQHDLPAPADIAGMQSAFASGLARQPWLDRWPATLGPVTPEFNRDRFGLRDASGRRIPLRSSFRQAWALMALSGGAPVRVFGEWDGWEFDPVTIATGGGLYMPGELGTLPMLAQAI
jgi:SWIM zinc finger